MTDPAGLLASQAAEICDSDTIPVLRMAQILELWGEALLAVLDLHAAEDHPQYASGTNVVCARCIGSDEQQLPYPCDTVRAIATALAEK